MAQTAHLGDSDDRDPDRLPTVDELLASPLLGLLPVLNFEPNTPLIRRGRAVGDILLVLMGSVEIRQPARPAVRLEAPVVFDRWLVDAAGQSRIDAVTVGLVCAVRVEPAAHARILGAFPALRRLSVQLRERVLGEREHLPHSSRSSM